MWEIAVHLDVVGGIYDAVFLCTALFPTRFGTELSQFLRMFLPTLGEHAYLYRTMQAF